MQETNVSVYIIYWLLNLDYGNLSETTVVNGVWEDVLASLASCQ